MNSPNKPSRVVLYTSDVQNITGLSKRTAQKYLQKTRLVYGKEPRDLVSIKEFCGFTGLDEELVKDHLLDE